MTREEKKALEARLMRRVEAGELSLVEASMIFDNATRTEALAYLAGMERTVF